MSEEVCQAPYVLILDDMKSICLWVTATLKPLGVQVQAAETREQAALLIKSCGMPQLAILDIYLAGDRGTHATTLLDEEVPIIIFSASSVAQSLPEGRQIYRLQKPASQDRLRAVVGSMLRVTPQANQLGLVGGKLQEKNLGLVGGKLQEKSLGLVGGKPQEKSLGLVGGKPQEKSLGLVGGKPEIKTLGPNVSEPCGQSHSALKRQARAKFLSFVKDVAEDVKAGQNIDLATIIHQLKGSCGIFGFPSVQQELAALDMEDIDVNFSLVREKLLVCLQGLPLR